MVMPLYCPGEPAEEKPRRPNELRHLADPKFLGGIFDDPFEVLACATLITAALPQPLMESPGYGVGRRKPVEKRDTAFLRSKWCRLILDALELDADRWQRLLREGTSKHE